MAFARGFELAEGNWDSYNEFLQKGSLDRFTKILARYELFKKVIDLPGDIVECGVFKGTGVLYWAKLLAIFNPLSARRVVGFDTFEGYPESLQREYDKKTGEGFIQQANYSAVGVEHIMGLAKEIGLEKRVELVKGDASITTREYPSKNPGFRIALLNLDFDVYEPTIEALKAFYPLVVPGGVIAFDEYALRGWGESDAVDEFFKDKKVVYKTVPWALSPTAFVVKE